jgi:Leucine-rich repeat (LRR) protein
LNRLWLLAAIVFTITIATFACGGGGGGEEPAQEKAEQVLAKEVAEDSRRAQRPGQRTVTEEQPVRVAAEGEVIFPDPAVEEAVREALKQEEGPIMIADVAQFTSFDLNQRLYVADISGLERMVNLTKFDLAQNATSDISQVAGLTKLTWLDLAQNDIADITPIAGLTNLTYLRLHDNPVSDISPLAELTSLTELDLRINQISDISVLSNLTNLSKLNLTSNQITDISALASLSELTFLELTRNEVTDISPLLEAELGEGTTIVLWGLPLDDNSENMVIPKLEEAGVRVDF